MSWGDYVTLTMAIQPSSSISQSDLKWNHNGAYNADWNGKSTITITSAKPSDAGVYECYTDETQRQSGLHGFMRLIVRGMFYFFASMCRQFRWLSLRFVHFESKIRKYLGLLTFCHL